MFFLINHNLNFKLAAVKYNAEYVEEQWKLYFKDANLDNYSNPEIKRQVELLKQIGTAGLEPTDLEQVYISSLTILFHWNFILNIFFYIVNKYNHRVKRNLQ